MLYSYYNHQWCNTYNDLDSISCDLIGPALWNQEDKDISDISRPVSTPLLGNSTKSVLVSSCAGPCRVEMNTNRSAIFRLLRLPTSDETSAYMTMENGDVIQTNFMCPALFINGDGNGTCKMKDAKSEDFWILSFRCEADNQCTGDVVNGTGRFEGAKGQLPEVLCSVIGV